ncbi:TPA: IS3 family transposase, partial [Candidatus Uhrbacteria bacterium]|nr:IS3 family transposase [Candidatus Uhrbacteria bacterium]
GYYKWYAHIDEPDKDVVAHALIKEIFERGKRKYGFRTIQMKLLTKGVVMNHKKITRIKNKYRLITKIRRHNPYKIIMKQSLEHRTFENKLKRAFNITVPFKVFCTDITYLWLHHRFAYLSVIKDIASGEIVGWHLSMHLEMNIVLDTVESMMNNPALSSVVLQDTMIHSDQGFHYTNPLYIEKIKELNMVQSMSRRGNCIDNAPIESFFGHLKDEVDYTGCRTFDELHSVIKQYVQYYNHERQQWGLQKMTPVGYRDHLLACA